LSHDDDLDVGGLSGPTFLGAGSGIAGVGAAILAGGFVLHITVNGIDYARAAAGGVACLFAAIGLLLALRARRFGRAGFAVLVGLGGLAAFALSGVLGLVVPGGLGGLFGPSADEIRANLLREGELTDVRVIARGDGRFEYTGRRGHERCEGFLAVHGSSTTSERTCHLPTELPELEAACRDQVAEACALAVRRLHGAEPIDWPRLNALTSVGCQLDQSSACFYLGVARERGFGGPVDLPIALASYEHACVKGDDVGCWNAGLLRFNGRGAAADPAAAIALWRRGCDHGSLDACERLGEELRDGEHAPRDLPAARAFFQRACDGDQGAGCTNLAALQLDGLLGPADPVAALPLYLRGCELRSAAGCRNAGELLRDGTGAPADPVRALALFVKACDELDDGGSCVFGGMLLHEGAAGLPQDRVNALVRFEHACRLRKVDGCKNSGVYYRDGLAGQRDLERARPFFRQACELGSAVACRDAAR
jgi:TPR repeat protein